MSVAIQVKNLSKVYRVDVDGRSMRQRDLHETLTDLIRAPLHRLRHGAGHGLHTEQFWALRNVCLEVATGDVLGLVGRNGAGKSTLLKVLARVTAPTSGRAEIVGRVGSLLEVGTGFHPDLSGRENIYLNGAILGMRQVEINRRFDEIVDFSGVERFLDMPIKRYSSGMKIRLAFAVAAHLDPEVLIVDEVLAVGDEEFQKKCIGKIQDVHQQQGRTVLFVSHNMAAVQAMCGRIIVMADGEVAYDGDVQEGVQYYLRLASADSLHGTYEALQGDQHASEAYVTDARATSRGESNPLGYRSGDPIEFTIRCATRKRLVSPSLLLGIDNHLGIRVVTLHSKSVTNSPQVSCEAGQSFAFRCEMKDLFMVPGEYRVRLVLESRAGEEQLIDPAFTFQIRDREFNAISGRRLPGIVTCRQEWSIES